MIDCRHGGEGQNDLGRAFGAQQRAAAPKGLFVAALAPACGLAPVALLWRPSLRQSSADLFDPASAFTHCSLVIDSYLYPLFMELLMTGKMQTAPTSKQDLPNPSTRCFSRLWHARCLTVAYRFASELKSVTTRPTTRRRSKESIDYKRDYLYDYFGFKTLEKSYPMLPALLALV